MVNWDRTSDLGKIEVPTLVIGAPMTRWTSAHMQKLAHQVQKGRYLCCPDGSHMAMYEDQQVYFQGL